MHGFSPGCNIKSLKYKNCSERSGVYVERQGKEVLLSPPNQTLLPRQIYCVSSLTKASKSILKLFLFPGASRYFHTKTPLVVGCFIQLSRLLIFNFPVAELKKLFFFFFFSDNNVFLFLSSFSQICFESVTV